MEVHIMSKKDNKFKQDNLTLNNSPEKKHCSTSINDHKDMLIEYNYDNASDFYVNEPGNAYLHIDPSELDDMKSNGLHVIDGGNQADKKTLKDYLALPEGARTELIDGEFYDMAIGLHFLYSLYHGYLCLSFEYLITHF